MLGPGICSSRTMSFEPELERSMPWGRDLFTFVTSAAGHMMRTLQRPRKNKPSKRQVNHRRFLHSMIQRKFAEIEAGNHQLASALFSTGASHSQLDTRSSQKTQPSNTIKNVTVDSSETEASAKQQNMINDTRASDSLVDNLNTGRSKSTFLKNRNNSLSSEQDATKSGKDSLYENSGEELENSLQNSTLESTAVNSEKEQFQSTPADLDNFLQVSNIILEDSIVTWLENIEKIQQNSNVPIPKSPDEEQERHPLGMTLFDISPTVPAVSPLSLDSCNFEVQLQTESDQMQPITESLQMDGMQNVELLDSTEGYLQSHHSDQRSTTTAWPSQDDQGCIQNNFTFLNTSLVGCVIDNQTDCSEGLDVGPQFAMLLQNSIKDLTTEQDFIDNAVFNPATCGSSYQNQSVYMAGQRGTSIDSDLNNCEMHSETKKEDQYTVNGMWNMMEEISKGLEPSNFSNNVFDSQVVQRTEHDHTDQALSQSWEHYHIYKGHTPSKTTDHYCVLLDECGSIDSGPTQNPISVYTSPQNSHSSSPEDFYSFSIPPQTNSKCKENSCLYSNGEGVCSIPSFDGVAQSFPATAHKSHPHPVSTPPLSDDWLFSSILAEENFKSMIKSPGHIYC